MKTMGFTSETKFNMTNFKNNCSGQWLEMSRACVDPNYRKYHVINLMWAKIISFIQKNQVRYLFGCPRINQPSPEKVGAIFEFLKQHYWAQETFQVKPLKNTVYNYQISKTKLSEREMLRLLPSLIKGYLKMGALICSEPAWNELFKTSVIFMMLDIEKMNSSFKSKILYETGS